MSRTRLFCALAVPILIAAAVPTTASAQVFQRECGLRNGGETCFDPGRADGFERRGTVSEARLPLRGQSVDQGRVAGHLVGQRITAQRLDWVGRPSAYGLRGLRPGLAYARFGREIYVVERRTGAILALALILAAAQ